MMQWRLTLAALLALLIAVPMAAPLGLLVSDSSAWSSWTEAPRLLALAGNTGLLLGGTFILAMPIGVAAAILLYRTAFFSRSASLAFADALDLVCAAVSDAASGRRFADSGSAPRRLAAVIGRFCASGAGRRHDFDFQVWARIG